MQGEGGIIGSHKSLPLTRHSNRNARLAGQNPSVWEVEPNQLPIASSAGVANLLGMSEGDDCASPGPIVRILLKYHDPTSKGFIQYSRPSRRWSGCMECNFEACIALNEGKLIWEKLPHVP